MKNKWLKLNRKADFFLQKKQKKTAWKENRWTELILQTFLNHLLKLHPTCSPESSKSKDLTSHFIHLFVCYFLYLPVCSFIHVPFTLFVFLLRHLRIWWFSDYQFFLFRVIKIKLSAQSPSSSVQLVGLLCSWLKQHFSQAPSDLYQSYLEEA